MNSYINSAYIQVDATDLLLSIEECDKWFQLHRKHPTHIQTQKTWELWEGQLDYLLDQYQSARKSITYKTKQEKAYVTKEPLWWLPPEEGRKLNKGKILLVTRLKRQSSFSQFLSLFR